MERLDARVKTELPVFVSPRTGEKENVANVVELSLSGLLLNGWETKSPGTYRLRLPLQENDDVRLYGDIIRINGSQSAIQFYVPERETTVKLWQFIRDKITYHDTCPYCANLIKSDMDYCQSCGWYLNFKDANYLDKHLKETMLHRVMRRMNDLNAEQRHRVLNLIDRELLAIKDRCIDDHFVGASEKMLEVFSTIRKVSATENPVLILGESGTGKELTASTIHELSRRKGGPFIAINCAEVPETLLDTELFGYEKGALPREKGKLEAAGGGTVFLKEISDMPLSLQARLLRVMEEGVIERLGGKEVIKADVRIMASSTRVLEQEVTAGRLLADLYRRLNDFAVILPPLRDRGEDKLIVAKYYLRGICMAESVSKRFSDMAIEALKSYSWPGNVQELISKIRRAVLISESDTITPIDLSLKVPITENIASLREARSSVEKRKLMEILEMTSHNISKASALLGVSRPTIYSLIKKYGIGSSDT